MLRLILTPVLTCQILPLISILIITNIHLTADCFGPTLISYIIQNSDCRKYWGASPQLRIFGGFTPTALNSYATDISHVSFMVTTVRHGIMPQQLLRETRGTAETRKKCRLKFLFTKYIVFSRTEDNQSHLILNCFICIRRNVSIKTRDLHIKIIVFLL